MRHFLTLSGKSGAGKTIIAQNIKEWQCDHVVPVISTTTRPARPSDTPGEYEYISKTAFTILNKVGEKFLWSEAMGEYQYGTRKGALEDIARDPQKIGILILTPRRAKTLRDHFPGSVYSIYITSPGDEELYTRLMRRGDTPEKIDERMKLCESWDRDAMELNCFDEFVDNNDGDPTARNASLYILRSVANIIRTNKKSAS